MINKNKYVQSLTQAKNDLKNGKSWGEVWTKVKTEFADLPSEQIDYDLGLEWRQTNAYQLYINGNLKPIKPPAKYDYFADLSLAKYKILQGDSISKVQKDLKNKYKSVDDVKLLTDLNSIKISKEPAGRLPVAGPMTPEIKKAQTVTPKEQKQIEAYQKTLDPDYLSGKKDAVKDQIKIEAAAIEQAQRIPAKVIELSTTGKVEVIRPEATDPTRTVEVVKPEPVTPVPKILPPETPYTEKAKPFVQETEPKPVYLKSDPIRASLLQGAFGNDPDIIDLDRKYGDNIDKMSLPENKDIHDEVVAVTKSKIEEMIKPILGATSPGYSYITKKIDTFFSEAKTNDIQYRIERAINDPKIDNTTVPNPFFAETVLSKYDAVLKDIPLSSDMSIMGSTPPYIVTKKWQKDKTITLMSEISDSTPMIVFTEAMQNEASARQIIEETKLEKWQIELKKRQSNAEDLNKEQSSNISGFSKIGLKDFGKVTPSVEDVNQAMVEYQMKVHNVPEGSIVGQVRASELNAITQEATMIGYLDEKLGNLFAAKGTEPARIIREKFSKASDELVNALSLFAKLDVNGSMRTDLMSSYDDATKTQDSLMQKKKVIDTEYTKLLATPGMEDFITKAQEGSAISPVEQVAMINYIAQNKKTIDRMIVLGEQTNVLKADMASNSVKGENAVDRYKALDAEIKSSFKGMMTTVVSPSFRKMIITSKIMDASEADQFINIAKEYEKNRLFIEQNNDKYLKELDQYDLDTQQALLEERVMQDKVQAIFDKIYNTSSKIVKNDKELAYYAGYDELYEYERQSKIAQAAAESKMTPFTIAKDIFEIFTGSKHPDEATKKAFGKDATSYDYKDTLLAKYGNLTLASFETLFSTAGKVITVPSAAILNSVDGLVRLNAKQGTYLVSGLEKIGLKGGFTAEWKEYNNNILSAPWLADEVGKALAETAAIAYKNLYTETFPQIVNHARDTIQLLEATMDTGAKYNKFMSDWFIRGLTNMGLPEDVRLFLESYQEVSDPYVRATRILHAMRLGMNNPDLPENADLLWTEYDRKVITAPATGRLEDFLDEWDLDDKRIEEIKDLNKNIKNFNDISIGTEIVIYTGNPKASELMKTIDKRNKFVAGKVSESRFITDEITNLYDIIKVGPDRQKQLAAILDLNDFNAIGLYQGNTKDWTEIPKGITIRVPKMFEEPLLSNMLFSAENRLKWAKAHPVRYTLFEEAILKNAIDPLTWQWVPGLAAIKFGSGTILKTGYKALATAAEKQAYLRTAKVMADFTWSMSRVLFKKKAPLPAFYNNPEKLGLFQLIGKGMELKSLDLTTLSVLRTKLAAMSVVKALPEAYRKHFKVTDNDIHNQQELATIEYFEALKQIVDEGKYTGDQIKTFLANRMKADPLTTQEERDIFRVFSEHMGISLQELEDVIDTSHPELYRQRVKTVKVTDFKDIVKPEIYNDPVRLKELIALNDFEKRQINPSKIPAGMNIFVSKYDFVDIMKEQMAYTRYISGPELEYMSIKWDKLDGVGHESMLNFLRVFQKEDANKIVLLKNPAELDASIKRMHLKYPEAKESINKAVDVAKEYRRRTMFFADAIENKIMMPVKMTDEMKLYVMDQSTPDKSAILMSKDLNTGKVKYVINKHYSSKFGAGVDLVSTQTKLYGKRLNNLEVPVGRMVTKYQTTRYQGGKAAPMTHPDLKKVDPLAEAQSILKEKPNVIRMSPEEQKKVSIESSKSRGVPESRVWIKENADGSTELMVEKASGQKSKSVHKWKPSDKNKEITLRGLLTTAIIRKDIGWLRTFFTDSEYAQIYGSRVKGTNEFTGGLLDKIVSPTKQTIKIKTSYARDFFEVISDLINRKKFSIEELEIGVFTGGIQGEFLLILTSAIRDLYYSNRRLFNITYGELKQVLSIIATEVKEGLPLTHHITPIEELTAMLMEKIDHSPDIFGDKYSKIIGKLLNNTSITEREMNTIVEELKSLAKSWGRAYNEKIIANKLSKEGLSDAAIDDAIRTIRTSAIFNTVKGESPEDAIARVIRTIPGFISPLNVLSDAEVKFIVDSNKVAYLYATNKINRRFTYLMRKNISKDMMPAVINEFTKPIIDAAVDLMAKLDLDSEASKVRATTIITRSIAHSRKNLHELVLPTRIVSHVVIDTLDKLEIEAATVKASLSKAELKYRDAVYAGKKIKNNKYKYFEDDLAKKVAGLKIRYNQLKDKAVKYAEEHGETFQDRLSNELLIKSNPRIKREFEITPEVEKALYSMKAKPDEDITITLGEDTPEQQAVLKFLRSRPDEFIEGSDFMVRPKLIKGVMKSNEIVQVMDKAGLDPLRYIFLDKENGMRIVADDLVNLIRLSINPNTLDKLKPAYFDLFYQALKNSDILSLDIFKKDFPELTKQRLLLMSPNELKKELITRKVSASLAEELVKLARRKGSSNLRKRLEPSEIEQHTVTGKTSEGLESALSETKSAKRSTPIGANPTAKEIPNELDVDSLSEVLLSDLEEARGSKVNSALNEKVMEEIEDFNAAFYAIRKALGISEITVDGLEPGSWRIIQSFTGDNITDSQISALNFTDGKYIEIAGGKLTDETVRRMTPKEIILKNLDRDKFVASLGVAFDVPRKMGFEELETSIAKTTDIKKLRSEKSKIESKQDDIDSSIREIKHRVKENDKLVAAARRDPQIESNELTTKIQTYENINKKFNESLAPLERSKYQLSNDLDIVNKKIDSLTDATDFLVNSNDFKEIFDSEGYRYVEKQISRLRKDLGNNPEIARELARYQSILDIIVPWNLAKTNGVSFTAKEIYQAVKGYLSAEMEEKLSKLSKLTEESIKDANVGNLKKIGLDDINLPTVEMTKISGESMKLNFYDPLENITDPKQIRVPKIDTITVRDIENTIQLKESIKNFLDLVYLENRKPTVIDLTGKLAQKLDRHAPEFSRKMHIISGDKITSEALENINTSAGTSLTSAEVATYNQIAKSFNKQGPVWLFGEETAKINPEKLKSSFINKALDENEKRLLSQVRKDADKIISKFRESIKGPAMLFAQDPNTLISQIIGIKDGDITKETIVRSAAINITRANNQLTESIVRNYMIDNNVGETLAKDFQVATKNKKLLIIADERHSVLHRDAKATLDEARENGMTFVFSKDMTHGELLIYDYLRQFPKVKMESIKNNEIALLSRAVMSGKPELLFTISKEFADTNRGKLFKTWTKLSDEGIIRIYKSSEKIAGDIQRTMSAAIIKFKNTETNFLPDFSKQKAIYGESPQDILVDLATIEGTNKIKKKLNDSLFETEKEYRDMLMQTIPDDVDIFTRRAMVKQIENDIASTKILTDQIKREVFNFGKGKRFLEKLRSKVSARLHFYGMYDEPQIGLNPGYVDVVPEYVMALRSADWILKNLPKISHFISGFKGVLMGSWIRAILLYRPRWHIWNAQGDGIRAIGASHSVKVMAQYEEALIRAQFQFYWKAFKETSKLPLELLPKAARGRLARFLKYDLIDIDFAKPIIKTKYFELKGSLEEATKLVRDGGITTTGEIMTPADAAIVVSAGIDRVMVSPLHAQRKINILSESGLIDRLKKRIRVIDSDVQIVSSVLESSRRGILFWNQIYKRSMSMAEAEMSIKKWIFDYRDLTLAGRLMRNIFPFYTFTSKSLQLYLELCLKYGPGVWRAATAILDAWEEQHKDIPDQYKDRIQIGKNIWWLTSFGVQEYFEILFNPTKMMESFIKNPMRMLFGLSFGPIGSAAMTVITGKGYYDTSSSTQEYYDRGWTTEDIQNFRNREESKLSDSISFDKSPEALYTFLVSSLPFASLADGLRRSDFSTVLRGNATFNSVKVRTIMNYFFGANYKKMEDIEIVFDTIMKLPPGEQYILQESLKKENPDLYDYLQQYSLLSKITKVLDATGKDWQEKAQDLVKSIVIYTYYNLEAIKHGSGDEWLNENPQYAKVMQEVWSTGAQTSSKIYGKEKFDVAQIQSIANKILSKVKDADDKKIAKMKMAGIDVPFTNAISKQDLRNAMYDGDGNFRLNSLDQLANIVDAYGLEGELFDINKVKTEAEKSYQDWKNLFLKAREEKLAADQKYYDSMSVVFKVLPNNLEDLSQEESAKVWNKYNQLLETLILSNPEYKVRYLADMPEWQRKYNEFKAKYSEYWSELRSKFDDPDNNFFKQFNKKPTWFRNWYFYDNPEKKITFPKFSLIFNELEKNPKLNYYDLFFQKLGDKDWDTFRKTYFKSNPEAFRKAQEYLKFQKMYNEFNAIDNLTWEGKRQKADFLKQHPDLTAYWARNDKSEETIIKQKQEKYFDILYQIPADGKGRDYIIKYYLLKAKADQFLKDNPDVQTYWDSKEKKVYTGKEKVIRDLLADYNKLTLQVDKTEYILKHPELSEYFLNLAPPGIRRLMILEKLYFQIDGSEKRTAFVKARPELAEFWEVKKMPASFLLNPSVRKEYQTKLDNFSKFTDAIQAKDSTKVELYRKSVDVEPDTSTEEGKWLASQMYQAAMKVWASTFGSIISTYFFRTLPTWIRDKYFEAHPKSKMLSYRTLSRAMEEGLRIYAQQNKAQTWADSLMYKYGKDMPYQLKEKVSREMIRLGKWTDRTSWSKEQWNEYQLDNLARTGRIRRSELSNNRLLALEAQRAVRTFTMSMFAKPLKEFGTINVFKGSIEEEKNPSNVFLGTEEFILRTIPVNKRVMKLFDYES